MKLVSYLNKKEERLGILFNDKVYDLQKSASSITSPSSVNKTMRSKLSTWHEWETLPISIPHWMATSTFPGLPW